MASKPKSIADLTPDPHNANKGTERGTGMLEESLRRHGAGRSVLVDKHNVIMAGNKTVEAAVNTGITGIRVVEVRGDELVVVKRMDLDLSKDVGAVELAVADNRAGEVGLEWDIEVLQANVEAGADLSPYFFDGELDVVLDGGGDGNGDSEPPEPEPETVTCPKCGADVEVRP